MSRRRRGRDTAQIEAELQAMRALKEEWLAEERGWMQSVRDRLEAEEGTQK
jgi:hypothetical protein